MSMDWQDRIASMRDRAAAAKNPNRTIWSMVRTLWAEDEDEFQVLKAGPSPRTELPLIVLVHPGDAVEATGPAVVKVYSRGCQTGMAAEISDLLAAGADAVVLHRVSSHYSIGGSNDCTADYRHAIEAIHRAGTVLYGDDLPTAAAWIEENLLASRRPLVVMSGAWAHHEWGCVTEVGKALEAAGATAVLSEHASICPGGDEERWEPRAGLYQAGQRAPSPVR